MLPDNNIATPYFFSIYIIHIDQTSMLYFSTLLSFYCTPLYLHPICVTYRPSTFRSLALNCSITFHLFILSFKPFTINVPNFSFNFPSLNAFFPFLSPLFPVPLRGSLAGASQVYRYLTRDYGLGRVQTISQINIHTH